MLSKSQARLFFLGGTAFFSAIFLALTVDTVRQVPERSNEQNLTESAVRGKHLFDRKNCMGCHTILGEGAYYAPELTLSYQRRGPEWIKVFLRDPQAMYPGQRKMVQYDFTEDEIEDLIAFLKWIGEIDTNGFPAEPDLVALAPTAAAAVVVATAPGGEPPEYFNNICVACHAVGGQGGGVGPALDGVATRYTPEELDVWLADPTKVKPGTAMPNLNLPDETRRELVAWLVTLQ